MRQKTDRTPSIVSYTTKMREGTKQHPSTKDGNGYLTCKKMLNNTWNCLRNLDTAYSPEEDLTIALSKARISTGHPAFMSEYT